MTYGHSKSGLNIIENSGKLFLANKFLSYTNQWYTVEIF